MDFLYSVGSIVLSMLFFSILFNLLNKSILNLFGGIQAFTSKLKRKKLYYIFTTILLIVSSVFIKDFFHFGYIKNGILLGMFFSLNEIVFDTRNTKII